MNFLIERIESAAQVAAAAQIREEVFGREWKFQVESPFEASQSTVHLLARSEETGEAIATLSVVETTGDLELHSRFGLPFANGSRVARYTQLAVRKPYRGMNVPLRMMVEAHGRFVVPGHFAHSWLLFQSERAASSSFCRLLGFQPGPSTYDSPYGRVRVLVRKEHATAWERQVVSAGVPASASINGHTVWHLQDGAAAEYSNQVNA